MLRPRRWLCRKMKPADVALDASMGPTDELCGIILTGYQRNIIDTLLALPPYSVAAVLLYYDPAVRLRTPEGGVLVALVVVVVCWTYGETRGFLAPPAD
eukprot:15617778-Heterocapsa_arctica.AAC.1